METLREDGYSALDEVISRGGYSCISYLVFKSNEMVEQLCRMLLSYNKLYNAKVKDMSVRIPYLSTYVYDNLEMNLATVSFKAKNEELQDKYYNIVLFYFNQYADLEYKDILQYMHDMVIICDYNGNEVYLRDTKENDANVNVLLLHNNGSSIINTSDKFIIELFGENRALHNIVIWGDKQPYFYTGLYDTFKLLDALFYNKYIPYKKFELSIVAKEIEYLLNTNARNISLLHDIDKIVDVLSEKDKTLILDIINIVDCIEEDSSIYKLLGDRLHIILDMKRNIVSDISKDAEMTVI